ncbi:MAG: WYL domain-containing protein [Cyanobacteria bacterium SZAS LIN-2]|nr:WYL domain-containing protein [Cyanobacteria bacterium SZAS LIN-2]
MSDTIFRHLTTLTLIPGRPGKISARQLHARLKQHGFDTHVRSIERDLHKLSTIFPLVSDEAHPAGWSWRDSGPHMAFPSMSLNAALTYQLLERYLTPLLPRGMLKDLKPQFDMATRVLSDLGAAPVGQWSKKIAAISLNQQLLPPLVDDRVREIVYEALFKNVRFAAHYHAREAEDAKRYTFGPLGLVYREGVLYLVATAFDYTDARQYALHRMSRAELLDEPVRHPKGFDFACYVREEKGFDYPTGRKIRLELIISDWLVRHLSESRLSEDQEIVPLRGGKHARVTATIMETEQLEWWLRSLGLFVEVRKPASLRTRIEQNAKALVATYARR